MNVKGNHPLAEILACKLFSIETVPAKEQAKMVRRAIKAAVEFYEKNNKALKIDAKSCPLYTDYKKSCVALKERNAELQGEFKMSKHIKCTGESVEDCYECNQYFSSHSLHYDQVRNQKVVDISCSIGGNKQFDEDGNEI